MTNPVIKLDHCVIHVSDWERSNAFYRDVLGAELIPVGSGWAYRFGHQQLNAGCASVAHQGANLLDAAARLNRNQQRSFLASNLAEWQRRLAPLSGAATTTIV